MADDLLQEIVPGVRPLDIRPGVRPLDMSAGVRSPEYVMPVGTDLGFPLASQVPTTWKDKRAAALKGPLQQPDNWMWMDLPNTKHSDWYDKGVMQKFVNAAKKYGVDPTTYIALGISESGLGNLNPDNPPQIFLDVHGDAVRGRMADLIAKQGPNPVTQQDATIDYGAEYLAQQMKRYPKDQLAGIQAYSGTGKTYYGGRLNPNAKFFGKPIAGQNLWRDKPQARRVMAINDALKQNQEFQKYIGSLTQ